MKSVENKLNHFDHLNRSADDVEAMIELGDAATTPISNTSAPRR